MLFGTMTPPPHSFSVHLIITWEPKRFREFFRVIRLLILSEHPSISHILPVLVQLTHVAAPTPCVASPPRTSTVHARGCANIVRRVSSRRLYRGVTLDYDEAPCERSKAVRAGSTA